MERSASLYVERAEVHGSYRCGGVEQIARASRRQVCTQVSGKSAREEEQLLARHGVGRAMPMAVIPFM